MTVRLLSDRELSRLEVLRDLDQRGLTVAAATQLLGLERRQVFRLLKAYRTEGPAGLISKRRGRSSNPAQTRRSSHQGAVGDWRTALGFRPDPAFARGGLLAAEKLREVHQITLGRETLRFWMIEAGIGLIASNGGSRFINPAAGASVSANWCKSTVRSTPGMSSKTAVWEAASAAAPPAGAR
ncbi:MAG: helix-turn-helix domain-containing protein [Alphaproteobacteria bacterium]|nr:helix-turn-helix domain-containing protein [Alphaproteobacteria bacterium]